MKYLWGFLAAGAYFFIANWRFGLVCPMVILFGIPCPGCGLTRAGVLFLTGNFAESFRMHPLLVPTVAFIMWAIVEKFFGSQNFKKMQNPVIVLSVSAFVLYIFRMIRMFPYYPPMVMNSESVLHNIIFLLRERI